MQLSAVVLPIQDLQRRAQVDAMTPARRYPTFPGSGNAAGLSAQPSPRAASSSGLWTMIIGAVRWYLQLGNFFRSISGVYFRMAAARRSAASRSRTAGPTQWAVAWVVLSQGPPQRGQALGLQGRPPRNALRAAAISRAALEVSLRAKEPPGSR
jgi:hypothetical protein